MQAMEISLTALDVEWRRLEMIAANLANMGQVEGTVPSVTLQRLVSGPRSSFASYMNGNISNASSAGSVDLRSLAGVEVLSIEPIPSPATPAQASEGGILRSSADHVEQMTLMIKTSRAYEANIVAMNTARQMYTKALELGRTT
jgi:flagellar basal-body rod protein FlgC